MRSDHRLTKHVIPHPAWVHGLIALSLVLQNALTDPAMRCCRLLSTAPSHASQGTHSHTAIYTQIHNTPHTGTHTHTHTKPQRYTHRHTQNRHTHTQAHTKPPHTHTHTQAHTQNSTQAHTHGHPRGCGQVACVAGQVVGVAGGAVCEIPGGGHARLKLLCGRCTLHGVRRVRAVVCTVGAGHTKHAGGHGARHDLRGAGGGARARMFQEAGGRGAFREGNGALMCAHWEHLSARGGAQGHGGTQWHKVSSWVQRHYSWAHRSIQGRSRARVALIGTQCTHMGAGTQWHTVAFIGTQCTQWHSLVHSALIWVQAHSGTQWHSLAHRALSGIHWYTVHSFGCRGTLRAMGAVRGAWP